MRGMSLLTKRISIQSCTIAFALVSISLSACGTNTNYVDLMRVTGETEVLISSEEPEYQSAAKLSDRVSAWYEIQRLREKQMIMAQRIRVASMPEVQDKTLTIAQGEAKKAELVAAATARYNEAKALKRPNDADMIAK